MSERSREAWAKILANRRAATAERRGKADDASMAVAVAVVAPERVTKTAENCGQPLCCMRGGASVTHGEPTIMRDGYDMGSYLFAASVKKPLICGGDLWIPKVKTEYEKRRLDRLATHASGLDEFAAKRPVRPVEESKYCKHGRPRNHCA